MPTVEVDGGGADEIVAATVGDEDEDEEEGRDGNCLEEDCVSVVSDRDDSLPGDAISSSRRAEQG